MQEFASLHKSICYSQSSTEYLRKCTILRTKKVKLRRKVISGWHQHLDHICHCVAYHLLLLFFFSFSRKEFSRFLSYIGF